MSVDIVDMKPGRFVLRKPDGTPMLDTTERNPAEAGRVTVTGLTVDWPVVPGENNEYLPLTGLYRHNIPAHQLVTTQTLGALSVAGVTPQLYLTNIKITQTLIGNAGPYKLYCRPSQNQTVSLVGSVLLEAHGIYVYRAINIAVSGGNLVLEKRQLGVGYDANDIVPNSTRSTYTMDIDVAWGVFDG